MRLKISIRENGKTRGASPREVMAWYVLGLGKACDTYCDNYTTLSCVDCPMFREGPCYIPHGVAKFILEGKEIILEVVE